MRAPFLLLNLTDFSVQLAQVLYPIPRGNITDVLRSDPEGRFSTFLGALEALGLVDVLDDEEEGALTVFAPTNEAFENLAQEDLDELFGDKGLLEETLLRQACT